MYLDHGCLFIQEEIQKKCKKVRGRPDGFAMSKFLKSASNASLTFLLVRDLMEVFLVLGEKNTIWNWCNFQDIEQNTICEWIDFYIIFSFINIHNK